MGRSLFIHGRALAARLVRNSEPRVELCGVGTAILGLVRQADALVLTGTEAIGVSWRSRPDTDNQNRFVPILVEWLQDVSCCRAQAGPILGHPHSHSRTRWGHEGSAELRQRVTVELRQSDSHDAHRVRSTVSELDHEGVERLAEVVQADGELPRVSEDASRVRLRVRQMAAHLKCGVQMIWRITLAHGLRTTARQQQYQNRTKRDRQSRTWDSPSHLIATSQYFRAHVVPLQVGGGAATRAEMNSFDELVSVVPLPPAQKRCL